MRTAVIVAALTAVFVVSAEARGGGGSRGFSYGTGSNSSSHYVAPHSTGRGGYTGGHYQTNPNRTRSDNYGSYGNINPHTGGIGDGYGRSRP